MARGGSVKHLNFDQTMSHLHLSFIHLTTSMTSQCFIFVSRVVNDLMFASDSQEEDIMLQQVQRFSFFGVVFVLTSTTEPVGV